jgi:hypothetical protein
MAVPNDPQDNPQPDVDLTVGNNQIVGDAPPSDGTDVDVTVSPTTAFGELLRSVQSQPVPETCGTGQHFHTASARAAACPRLQPEIESFGAAFSHLRSAGSGLAPPGGD